MPRLLKRSLVALLLLLALVFVALVVAPHLVDLRGVLASRLSAALGREVGIEGSVRLRPGVPPGLRLTDLRVGEPSDDSPLRRAQVGRLDVVVALWPLLRRELDVRELEIEDAALTLDLGLAGEGDDDEAREASTWDWRLGSAQARNLQIELLGEGSAPTRATFERVGLRSHDGWEVLELTAAGEIAEIPFDLSGRYDRPQRARTGEPGADIALEGRLAGAKLSGKGTLAGGNGTPELALRLDAAAPHLHVLSGAAGRELPRLGPVRASGLLEAKGERLGVTDLDLQVGNRDEAWLEVDGYLRDARRLRQFSLRSSFGIADVRALGPLVGEPPDIGRIEGRATVHDVEGPRRLQEFILKGGRAGVFEVDAHGRFLDIDAVDGLDAQVDLKARDLAVLGELLHRELPAIAPLEFAGRVSGRAGEVATEGLRARLDKTIFEGSASASLRSGRRPQLRARLEVPELHLDDVGLEPRPGSEPPAAAAPSGQLFSDGSIELGWAEQVDGELVLAVGRVVGVGGPLVRDVQTDLRLREGKLAARHASVHVEGGTLRGELELDARAKPPVATLRASAQGIRIEQLVAQFDERGAYSGHLEAKLDLSTRGDNPRALVSGLDGDVLVGCGRGTIDPRHAGIMTRDLFHAIRRVAGTPTSEVLNCLVLDFGFREGIGTARTLLLDTEGIAVVGEGDIDLGAETLDLRLVPRPRKASALSTAATVRVTGSLSQPRVTIEKGSLVKSSTEAMFKHLLPVGTLHRLWRRVRGKQPGPSPCEALAGAG